MKEPLVLLIKPVSNNDLYGRTKSGGVYKKRDAKEFEKNVYWMMKAYINKIALPPDCNEMYTLKSRFFVSGRYDTSNCVKLFEDCLELQLKGKYGKFNDRQFYGHITSKSLCKEGDEKIMFQILPYNITLFDF